MSSLPRRSIALPAVALAAVLGPTTPPPSAPEPAPVATQTGLPAPAPAGDASAAGEDPAGPSSFARELLPCDLRPRPGETPGAGPEYPVACARFGAAPERQEHARVATAGDMTLVVWDDPGTGRTRAARVAADGTLLDPAGFLVGSRASSDPDVTSNGDVFLVVWSVHDRGVVAARVARSGRVLDPEPIELGSRASGLPAAGSDGRSFLVAWLEGDGILARRVGADGSLPDAASVRVGATDRNDPPAVAWNGSEYLVAWTDDRPDRPDRPTVGGARVGRDGVLLDPVPIEILRTDEPIEGGVAASRLGEDFLVAWSHDRRIEAARVTAARTVVRFTVRHGRPSRDPAMAWNGDLATVLWSEDQGLRAAQVSPDTSVTDRGRVVGRATSPAVAATARGWFAAWIGRVDGEENEVDDTGWDAFAARLDPSATRVAGGPAWMAAALPQRAPSVASADGVVLTVWQGAKRGNLATLYAARTTPDGRFLDDGGIVVTTTATRYTAPAVASDGESFLVAWTDGRRRGSDVYAARIDRDGRVLDPEGIDVSPGANNELHPAVAGDASGFLVAWIDSRDGRGEEFDVFAARVGRDGRLADPDGIAVARESKRASDIAAASNGRDFIVAWSEERRRGPNRLRASLVSHDGLVAGGALIIGSSRAQASAAVASDGSGFLIVWEEYADAFEHEESADPFEHTDVRAARIAADGSVVDRTPIPVAADRLGYTSPSVAFRPGSYLVAWTDRMSPDASTGIAAARVSPDGRLDARVSVSSAEEFEWRPAVTAVGDRWAVAYQRFAPESPYANDRVFLRLFR